MKVTALWRRKQIEHWKKNIIFAYSTENKFCGVDNLCG